MTKKTNSLSICVSLAALILVSLCLSSSARATTVIGFDDITPVLPNPGYGSTVLVPDGYGGLDWNEPGETVLSASAGHSAFDDGDITPFYGAIFGTATHTVTSPGGTFDFVGAYFTGGWFSKTAPVMGFLGGVQIHSTTVSATDNSPVFHSFNWIGIDKLVFPIINDGGTPGNNDDYVVDNFTINNLTSVPEPSTYVMAAIGLLGLGFVARRRRRS